MKYTMFEYQKKVIRLRMLRPDLSERTIADEVQKIASKYPVRIQTVLKDLAAIAAEGSPMPWEIT